MIKHGVALMRLASSPHGCAAGDGLEEFYVVVFDGNILPTRFMSYAEAYKHSEGLYYANVA